MASNNAPTDQVVVIQAGEGPSEGVGVGEGPPERARGHPMMFPCQRCGIRVSPAFASARQCKQRLYRVHLGLIANGLLQGTVGLPLLTNYRSYDSPSTVAELYTYFILLSVWFGVPLGCYMLFRSVWHDGPHCCKCLKEDGTWSTPYYWMRACRFCKKRAAGGQISIEATPTREYSFEQVKASTRKLLSSESFSTANPDSLAGLLKRLELLKQAGIPPMKVLPMSTLIELGRIPHSSEGFAIDAADALAGFPQAKLSRPMAPIYFFSHRWLRPDWCEALQKNVAYGTEEWQQAQAAGHRVGDPDDTAATKARSLIQTLKWLAEEHAREQAMSWEEVPMKLLMACGHELYKEQPLREVLLWIDWPCVDQSNPLPEIAALPAYVACCSGIMAAYNETYMTRGWCRVEILNAFAFCSCNTMWTNDKMYIRYGGAMRSNELGRGCRVLSAAREGSAGIVLCMLAHRSLTEVRTPPHPV